MSLRVNGLMRRSTSNYDLPTTVRTHSHSPAQKSYTYGNSNGGYKSLTSRHGRNKLLIRAATAIASISLLTYLGSSYLRTSSSGDDADMDGLTEDADIGNAGSSRDLEKKKQTQTPSKKQQQQQHDKPDCPPFRSSFGGAVHPGYFRPEDAVVAGGTSFKFAAITDLDNLSKVENASKPTFRADVLTGALHRSSDEIDLDNNKQYTVSFDEETRELTTRQNEGGRGAEYSELTLFDHRLLTFDDRTGAVVELLNAPDGPSTFPVTRYVLTEGNGDTNKGMKWEWATVKDDELYIGGIGKEMQLSNGDVDTEDAMWIAIIGKAGQLRREDWSSQYNFVRKFLGCQLPGYIAHEAIEWSAHLRKWIFLPRRVSLHQYVPDLDERLGSNKVIVVNEDFSHATVIEIDLEHHEAGLRGFSSFSFVPNTLDQHVLALRSVEEDCVGEDSATTCKFKTYMCVFELLTGDVLMEEVLIDHPVKFEGVEFVDMFTTPPPKEAEPRLRGAAKES
jgi:soluble calcium-activated nucleotidase 1